MMIKDNKVTENYLNDIQAFAASKGFEGHDFSKSATKIIEADILDSLD
jgi:hypothetical protein